MLIVLKAITPLPIKGCFGKIKSEHQAFHYTTMAKLSKSIIFRNGLRDFSRIFSKRRLYGKFRSIVNGMQIETRCSKCPRVDIQKLGVDAQ